jgi:hypothetical protein
VRVHHQRASILFEILASGGLPAYQDRHAEQHAHAAASTRFGEPVLLIGL